VILSNKQPRKTAVYWLSGQMTRFLSAQNKTMGKPTETKYDGWAVIPKTSIEGENPANWHIAEVKLDTLKEKIVAFNGNRATCCGRQIKENAPMPKMDSNVFYPKGDDKRLRNNLAFWQNGEDECCGNCVGHFYKDPNGSNK